MTNKIENFYQQISVLPIEIEVATLQIGRSCDFQDECVMLKMAFDYFKKIDKKFNKPLTKDNYIEFSNMLNAPVGDRTMKQQEKIAMQPSMPNFDDVGDRGIVILPVAYLHRKQTNMDLITDLECRINLEKNPEAKKRIDKLRCVEVTKEQKLRGYLGEKFYDEYLMPDDMNNYCYLRSLVLYYYNQVTPDVSKTSLRTETNIFSYLNFLYPNGNIEQIDPKRKQTFQDIHDITQHMSDEQIKQFLSKMQLDQETLDTKLKEEQSLQQMIDGPGLL